MDDKQVDSEIETVNWDELRKGKNNILSPSTVECTEKGSLRIE